MKKVFLIDDEAIIRNGIRESIDWEKEGYIFCGDAPDGEVALPLIEKHQPDIIITDIKMPFMDGLELSKVVRKKMPTVKIIILSGHDEFEYAREALRIKVTEYCLKPVSASDLLEILHRVSLQIDQEANEQRQLNYLKDQLLQSASLERETFLKELCEGIYPTADAIKKAASLNIDLLASYYLVLIIESKNTQHDLDWISTTYSVFSYQRKAREIVFIMKGESKVQLEHAAEKIRNQLLLHKDTLTFGFGRVESRIQGIMYSYTSADEEKSYSAILDNYYIAGSESDSQPVDQIHQFNRKELITFLKFGTKAEARSFAKSYSSYLTSDEARTPFVIYYFLMDFTITITHYIKEQEESTDVLKRIHQLENKVSWIREYTEIVTYMEEILHLVIDFQATINCKYSSFIQKAKMYIDENYHNPDLSLQSVANEINISPSYLSHVFSQESGQTLIEYVTQTRMEKAKALLQSTNYKTYEIANKVGYSDSHYFCNLFKKTTGMTTTQYKNSNKSMFA